MRTRTLLCPAPRCSDHGRHGPECQKPYRCRGCQAREAAPGLELCWAHRNHIEKDALRAAEVYHELLLAHTPSRGAVEYVTGSPEPVIPYQDRPGDDRTEIRHVLCGWASLIMEKRGFAADSSIDGLARLVSENATWLAAQPDGVAVSCSTELRDLACKPIAPSGTRFLPLGDCPVDDCDGTVRAILRRPDTLLPRTEVSCTTDSEHVWGAHRWPSLLGYFRRAEGWG